MKLNGLVIKSHRPVISRSNYSMFFIETSVVAAVIFAGFIVVRAILA